MRTLKGIKKRGRGQQKKYLLYINRIVRSKSYSVNTAFYGTERTVAKKKSFTPGVKSTPIPLPFCVLPPVKNLYWLISRIYF